MAWKWCDMCSESFGDCRPTTASFHTVCNVCLRWRRMMHRRLRCELEFFDSVDQFVYAWVELTREPNSQQPDDEYTREYTRLLDEGIIFYIGRGERKRLTDAKDRNPYAVDRRQHLSEYRSFGFQLLGGGDSAHAKDLEEYSIQLFNPPYNLQWWYPNG